MLYAIVGLLVLLADQFTKFWTVDNIALNAYPGKPILGGLFHLTYIKNTGAMFGLMSKFSALRWILLVLLLAFTAFIVLGIWKGFLRTGFARWTGTLLLAGLLGNGIDRTFFGFVVDMIEPTLGSLHLPIFNLADCLVLVFGILFVFALFFKGGIGVPDEADEYEDEDEDEYVSPRRRLFRRDVEDDEEEEEEAPVRRGRRNAEAEAPVRRARRGVEEDAPVRRTRREAEDETPVRRRRAAEEEAPVRRAAPAAQTAARRSRPAVDGQAEAAARQHRAEFENALNARRAQVTANSEEPVTVVKRPATAARPAAATTPVERPAVTARPAATATVERPVTVAAERPVTAARPSVTAKPAAATRPVAAAPTVAPAVTPETAKPAADDEFDLDSILAEFK